MEVNILHYREGFCQPQAGWGDIFLTHIPFQGLAEIRNGLGIPLLGRVYDAMGHMALEDHDPCPVQCRPYGAELYQYLGTVPAVQHHLPDGFQMPDGPSQPVGYGADLLWIMGMGVRVKMVVVMMGMLMFAHRSSWDDSSFSLPRIWSIGKPPRGI